MDLYVLLAVLVIITESLWLKGLTLQLAILEDAPEMHHQLVSSHGLLAIVDVLEGSPSREVIAKLLRIVNLVST